MKTTNVEKNKCTCGTGEPCCVHEAGEGKQKEEKMQQGGCCEPNCSPGVCK